MTRAEELARIERYLMERGAKQCPKVPAPDLGRVRCHEQGNMVTPARSGDVLHFTSGYWTRPKPVAE